MLRPVGRYSLQFRSAMAFIVLCGSVALACQVPVFRYALERWEADPYEVIVIHQGQLNDEVAARVDKLKAASNSELLPANFHIRVSEAKSIEQPPLKQLWDEREDKSQPLVVVLYPRSAHEVPDPIAMVAPLTDNFVKYFADSPIRQTIAKSMIAGESAVWVFVPSGNAQQDAAAMKRLQEQVASNQKSLELPEQEEPETEEDLLKQSSIELRIGFKIVTLDRNDPKEQVLLSLLMESEPDLKELSDQPMAFPVLGRGRVLYALVGRGIGTETIGAACRFMVGPCSCQVKTQNPGFDLLMAYDWDSKIAGQEISDPLPEENSKPILLKIPTGKSK